MGLETVVAAAVQKGADGFKLTFTPPHTSKALLQGDWGFTLPMGGRG